MNPVKTQSFTSLMHGSRPETISHAVLEDIFFVRGLGVVVITIFSRFLTLLGLVQPYTVRVSSFNSGGVRLEGIIF